jgi:hypothetical protein
MTLSRLPVVNNELRHDDRLACLDVDAPFVRPFSSVRRYSNAGSYFSSEVVALVDGDFVACMAERDRCAETAETSTDDNYVHALEICCHDPLRTGSNICVERPKVWSPSDTRSEVQNCQRYGFQFHRLGGGVEKSTAVWSSI